MSIRAKRSNLVALIAQTAGTITKEVSVTFARFLKDERHELERRRTQRELPFRPRPRAVMPQQSLTF